MTSWKNNVRTVVDNSPVEPWMVNQPLSANNIDNSTAGQNNVISANKREELERQKIEGVLDTSPVPEDVTKKTVATDVRPELLVKEYVGNEYQALVMSPSNFGAFVFGAAYYAYRKMYVLGIINIAIVLGLLFFVPLKYNVLAVVGSKSDNYEKEEVKEEEARKYAKSIGATYMLTSAKTGDNIDLLFDTLIRQYLGPDFVKKVQEMKQEKGEIQKVTRNTILEKKKKKKFC